MAGAAAGRNLHVLRLIVAGRNCRAVHEIPRCRGPRSMNGLVLLHAAPGAGFEAPFEMLAACHERVERSLRLLERLAKHIVAHGADAQARDAAKDVLRYFDIAAPHHHEDEERHVLPLLRAHGQAALAARLHADHEAMGVAWAALRPALHALSDGDASAALAASAHHVWRDFAALYRAHAQAEDSQAFPSARALLDGPAQRAMGQEMAQRRGVSSDAAPAPISRPAPAPTASR
jgi:hemerythrin-like domain-containing protein